MNESNRLTDDILEAIEQMALGKSRATRACFSHPADTLLLVAEVRRLREENKKLREALPEKSKE